MKRKIGNAFIMMYHWNRMREIELYSFSLRWEWDSCYAFSRRDFPKSEWARAMRTICLHESKLTFQLSIVGVTHKDARFGAYPNRNETT